VGATIRVNDWPAFTGGHRVNGSVSNIVFTKSESGRVPSVQLTTRPSKQSIMGERYTLPAGIWNSVMSVSHFSFGMSAWKSRLMRFSGAGLISPRYDPYRRFSCCSDDQAFLFHQALHDFL
jgi:hypothetical protein